jgi:hypothetical protein
MLKIYYNNSSDYNNKNRFKDQVEGNNSVIYNALLSPTSADFYYKVNNKLEKINLQMADFIPLAVSGMRLIPNSFTVNKTGGNGVEISYNSLTNLQSITIV